MTNIEKTGHTGKSILIASFAIAFAYVETSVVVYLRELFYPEGFTFPLKSMPLKLIVIELVRELATMIMLGAVAMLTARRAWERFGYFIIAFGVWDIFYYIWLKATIDWPSSIFEWDILFLIPVPWIGPVVAPVLISILMIVVGFMITRLYSLGSEFEPGWLSWSLAILATVVILYSFTRDFSATLNQQMPQPYQYSWLVIGLLLYGSGFAIPYRKALRTGF
jgi:hypothetical protein